MRQTRSQTRKQQQQQEQQALDVDVAADSDPPQAQSSKPSILSIFLNDFTDADNEAAALLWAWSLELNPEIKGIYIAEPRHVNVGYYMTAKDFGACIGLVGKLSPAFPGEYSPLRIVLGGDKLDDTYINDPNLRADGKELTSRERDLLKRCKRPENGETDDAIKHARLVAMDYLTTMKARCSRPFDAYVDTACLKYLESPINLKTHYHDELIARSAEELREFREITKLPTADQDEVEDRRDKLRKWYDKALARKKNEFGDEWPVKEMDSYDALYDEIRSHDRTIFLGGASLTIVQHIIRDQPDLAQKVEYYQQGGTFDSKLNILGNPLNFALNTAAAKYVFDNAQKGKLRKLVLVSTTTTQKLEFTAKGLTELHPAVGVRAVGFFGRLDPWELVSPKESPEGEESVACVKSEDFLSLRAQYAREKFCADDTFKGKKAVMADLVAFLICFTNVFDDYEGKVKRDVQKVAMVQEKDSMVQEKNSMVQEKDSMVMKLDPEGSIESMMLELFDLPEGQKALLVDDSSSLAEEAMKTFRFP